MVQLVDVEQAELVGVRMGALPIVGRYLERIGLRALFDQYVDTDPRATVSVAGPLVALVANLVVERAPAYKLIEWATGRPGELLGLGDHDSAILNDDRCGRSLDALFEADRATMLTRLMTGVIAEFKVALDELHNDATTLSMQGDYPGTRRSEKRAPQVRFGHAKERPDLAQLIWLLTVSADGAVPITYRLADGNTPEDPTHIETWEACCVLAGRRDFLYCSDSKLANRKAMTHIDKLEGRFLTVLPRTRSEDGDFREWITTHNPVLEEVLRRPGRRKDDPDDVYWATPAPAPSAEGFRIVWVLSSVKEAVDTAARKHNIDKARRGIAALNGRLAAPRNRSKSESVVETEAAEVIAQAGASRWVRAELSEEVTVEHRQESRGRPGPNTRYVRTETKYHSVRAVVDEAAVRHDAAADGFWPLITNDDDMPQAELVTTYKRQPWVERPHHVVKEVIGLVPVYLKSNERIDALGFLGYVALLIHALVERDLRRALAASQTPAIAIYPEGRTTKAPTAARVFEVLEPLCAQQLVVDGAVTKCFNPELSELHHRILDLLHIPATAYRLF